MAREDEVIKTIEAWGEDHGKWHGLIIEGKEEFYKRGIIYDLAWDLPRQVWYDQWNVDLPNDWPIGAKIKTINGNVVAMYYPNKGVWLRFKEDWSIRIRR